MKKLLLVCLLFSLPFSSFAANNKIAVRAFSTAIKKYPGYAVYYLSVLGVDCSDGVASLVAAVTGKKTAPLEDRDSISLAEVKRDNPFFVNIASIQTGTQYHTVTVNVSRPFGMSETLVIQVEVNKEGDVVGAEITGTGF